MSHHTPGPWTVEIKNDGKKMWHGGFLKRSVNIRCQADDEDAGTDDDWSLPAGTYVCEMQSSRSLSETHANALLIAASPTLLVAALSSIEAIEQGEADMALIYLRHAVDQSVKDKVPWND